MFTIPSLTIAGLQLAAAMMPVFMESQTPATVDDLIAHARISNPELRAAALLIEAASERSRQSGYLEDPELMYGYIAQSMRERQVISLVQRFPFPGTLNERKRLSASEALQVLHQTDELKRNLIEQIRTTHAQLMLLTEETRLTTSHLEILDRVLDTVALRVESGSSSGSDLIRTKLTRSLLEDHLRRLEAQRPGLEARLRRLLGLQPDAELPELLPAEPDPTTLTMVQENTLLYHPRILEIEEAMKSADAAVELADLQGKPMIAVGVEWMEMPAEKDSFMIKAGVSLPIWRERHRSAQREARTRHHALAAERLARIQSLQSELANAQALLRDAMNRIAHYQNQLLPEARLALELEMRAFQSGSSDLLRVLDSQRMLIDLQRNLSRSTADALQAQATLWRIIHPSTPESF